MILIKYKPVLGPVTSLAMIAAVAGCGGRADNGRPTAVATTTQVGDLVRTVGGSRIKVVQIAQPSMDIHQFDPKPSAVKGLSEAEIIFVSGAGLDRWYRDLKEGSGSRAKVVDLFKSLPTRRARTGRGNPHWWGNLKNVEAATRRIAAALGRQFPASRNYFERRAAKYNLKVAKLDANLRHCFAQVPEPKRRVVTNHDAFGYFANRYGIEVAGAVIPSTSTHAQPSSGETEDLIKKIRAENVRVVLAEATVNRKLSEAIAAESGAEVVGPLYLDSLGPSGSDSATVFGATELNGRALLTAMSRARCLRGSESS